MPVSERTSYATAFDAGAARSEPELAAEVNADRTGKIRSWLELAQRFLEIETERTPNIA